MSNYFINNEVYFDKVEEVTENHFGVNLVTIYDEEYVDPASNLSSLVEEIGITNLRYPGGAATEYYFDMANPNATLSDTDNVQTLLPMDKMFEQAGESRLSVSIVLPTRTGFEQTAYDAMRLGNYGSRKEISEDYLRDLKVFIRYIVESSEENGVPVSALEIGNEFWGSGEMTASEYGYLVANLLPKIESFFEELGAETPDLVVQGTSSASEVYSPNEDTVVYIDPEAVMHGIYSKRFIDERMDGNVPSDWIPVEVKGQGSAYTQISNITSEINKIPGSADHIDGVLHHYYVSTGLNSVDESHRFMFSQYGRFEELLNRSESLESLSFHVTEWNTNFYGQSARGLQHGAMMVEMFFEQVTHGIDSSQIWPLTFDKTQNITLTDVAQQNLTIAGQTYSLMRDNLIGMSPILDWSKEGEIDMHGFSDGEDFVFIVSERSGGDSSKISLDLSEVIGEDIFFVRSTMLSDGGKGGADHRADPVISIEKLQSTSDGVISLEQDPWSLTFVQLTKVNSGAGIVRGSSGQDKINGSTADDCIHGLSSSDFINGKKGFDSLMGGEGGDEILGGGGNDQIFGNSGKDKISGGCGSDTIFGGTWHDTIRGSFGQDHIFGEGGRDEIHGGRGNDKLFGGDWDDTLFGNGGGDTIFGGNGHDVISGGGGDDYISGEASNDSLRGGNGDDTILGGEGRDTLSGGVGNDVLVGGSDIDHFVFFKGNSRDTLRDFERGVDVIDLRAWGISDMLDIQVSEDVSLGVLFTTLSYNGDVIVFENTESDVILSALHYDFILT